MQELPGSSATHAAKQILWHRALFDELEIPQPETSILFTNNQAAIAISHHPEFHARTKHIDFAHHFLRDLIESGTIETTYIQTRAAGILATLGSRLIWAQISQSGTPSANSWLANPQTRKRANLDEVNKYSLSIIRIP